MNNNPDISSDKSPPVPPSSQKNALVSFKDVSKVYWGNRGLHNLTLDLREGEIFGYIGPNGAGKTTTMKVLVGLINKFQGELTLAGHRLPAEKNKVHQLIGYLPQGVSFQRWRTVDNALRAFGLLSGLENSELDKLIPYWLDRFELGQWRERKVRQLSGGMMQKVGFIQALLHKPKLLVLDEPLSGLDPASRLLLKDVIRDLRDQGTTIIFSSHILSDVQDVADRMGLISEGHLRVTGTLEDLKRHIGIPNELVVEFSQLPTATGYLGEIAGKRPLKKVTESQYSMVFFPDDNTDELIHRVITETLANGGKIRKAGNIPPSLDLLYMRFLGKK